jgi:hypothetical protein
MSESHQTSLLKDRLYFSCSQFSVYDSVELPGFHWTDQHIAQGFARRESNASFRTMLEHGFADVEVLTCRYEPHPEHVWAISVPFTSTSGVIAIEGPEEVNLVDRKITVRPENYRLVVAQGFAKDEKIVEKIWIFFEPAEVARNVSEILRHDDNLVPPLPLLESAEDP